MPSLTLHAMKEAVHKSFKNMDSFLWE